MIVSRELLVLTNAPTNLELSLAGCSVARARRRTKPWTSLTHQYTHTHTLVSSPWSAMFCSTFLSSSSSSYSSPVRGLSSFREFMKNADSVEEERLELVMVKLDGSPPRPPCPPVSQVIKLGSISLCFCCYCCWSISIVQVRITVHPYVWMNVVC